MSESSAPQPVAKLHIRNDEGDIETFSLTDAEHDEITVGRDRTNTVQLRDITVSRHHARLTRIAVDRYTVEDLESYNGVIVNGERIEHPMEVSLGDRIIIGSHQLWFEGADGRGAFDCPTIRIDQLTPPKGGAR